VLVFLAGAVYRFDGKLSMNGDDAEFLILGRAIAEGKGMVNLNEPEPTPHTKYPFFFPALLAALQTAAPGSILVPKVLVVLLGAGAAWLFARLLLSIASMEVALVASLAYATNPFVLEFSYQVLSETPFLFLGFLALVLFRRWEEKGGRGFLIGASAAAFAAYFTRTAGVALVAAILAAILLRRRGKVALVFALAFLAAAGSWAARNRAVGGGSAYVTQFLVKDPYNPDAGRLTLAHFFEKRLGGNLRTYGTFEMGRGILAAPFAGRSIGQAGSWRALALALALFSLAGLAVEARRRLGVIEIYTVLLLLVCLVWPEIWGSIRFLLPALPFLLYYTVRLAMLAAARGGAGAARAAPALLLVVLLASNVRANAVERPGNEYPPAWRNYEAAAAWARSNTPPESVIVCRKPGLFYVWSGRRSVVYLWSEDRKAVYDKLVADGVDYVVVAPLSATTPRYLVPVINEHRDRFEVVHQLRDPDTYVLRFLPEERP